MIESMEAVVDDFESVVRRTTEALKLVSEEDSERRPAPRKWSRKEIIGHLIDSAANNHARFVRARTRHDLVFDGYDQNAWIAAQEYQRAPWLNLIELWMFYNLHIAHVMRCTSMLELKRPREQHSLDKIAWKSVPATEPTTLEYLMHDYIGHMKHHLHQAQVL